MSALPPEEARQLRISQLIQRRAAAKKQREQEALADAIKLQHIQRLFDSAWKEKALTRFQELHNTRNQHEKHNGRTLL